MSNSANTRAGRRDLTEGPLFWTMFRLAAPLAAGMFLRTLYNLVDAYWLGKLNKEAMAAPGVTMPLIFALLSFGMGFGSAATALVAQHTGAKQHREADHTAAQSLVILTVIAAVVMLPVAIFTEPILRLLRVPEDVMPSATAYLRIMMLGMPLSGFSIGYSAVLRALGDTHTVVIVNLISNMVNLVLDPLLIFGIGPFPALGVSGAALASLISIGLSSAFCFHLMRRGRAGFRPRRRDFIPDRAVLGRLFDVGVPAGLSISIEGAGFVVFQMMINSLGAVAIGAFMIGSRIVNFLDIVGNCTAMAAAPVVGQALGAGKVPLARRVVLHSAGLVAATTILPYAFLMWQGGLIARFFVNDAAVIAETRLFFFVIPASSYFFNVLSVLLAAYRGSGHMRLVLVVTVFRQWILRLPICLILAFTLAWGSMGVYAGMTFANIAAAGLAWWLFHRGGWETAVIPVGPAAEAADAPLDEPADAP